ncbi:MAG: hypothetical protein WCB67_13490 [Solirubrobacteraceae bacterium]
MRAPVRAASAAALALALGCVGAVPKAGSAQGAPNISLTAAPQAVNSGARVVLSGTARDAAPASLVTLHARPYPYTGTPTPAGSTVTNAAGGFSFTATPSQNTRYSARLGPAGPEASVTVGVIGKTVTRLRALPWGRALVTLVIFHPRGLRWGHTLVRWAFASGRRGRFASTPPTRSIALSPSVTVLRTAVTLPAGPYRFRACFGPPAAAALLSPRRPPGCTGRGYQGGASLPAGFPSPAAVVRAAGYLAGRSGRRAFAVMDTEGRISGVNVHARFTSASVVKAMLLVAYLRRLGARGQRQIDAYSASFLYPMIHVSDNQAATTCQSYVGDAGLYAVARAANMTDFSVAGFWLTAELSPADQAHFFSVMDSLIPREFVGYARYLLSTIEPSQTWGVPPVARPLGYRVFFKDGSEPTARGQLVHQVDRLEGHGRVFSVAVMTDGDPSMVYGEQTISGIAAALLR